MKKSFYIFLLLFISFAGYTADSGVYINSKYGFELSLPNSWSGYKIVELPTNWPAGIIVSTWYVCLPTKDVTYRETKDYPVGYAPVIAFTLFTHDQFKKIKEDNEKNQGMPVDEIEIFKQNKKFIVSYSGPQSLPPDLDGWMRDINSIMKTFKFINEK